MAWSPKFLDDGDAFSSTNLNAAIVSARTTLNALPTESLRRGAFNLYNSGTVLSVAENAYTIASDDGQHTYSRAVFGASLAYSSFGANGGTEDAGSYTGDRVIIGHPDATGAYTGPLCKYEFTNPVKVGMGNGDRTAGIWCLLNVQLVGTGGGPEDILNMEVMVCLQYKVAGDATWYTIPVTERFIHVGSHRHTDGDPTDLDIPIRTVIRPSTLIADGHDPATDGVKAVRGMISFYDSSTSATATLERWNLTVLPLHAELAL